MCPLVDFDDVKDYIATYSSSTALQVYHVSIVFLYSKFMEEVLFITTASNNRRFFLYFFAVVNKHRKEYNCTIAIVFEI